MKYFLSLIIIIIIILSAYIYWLLGTKTISGQVFIVTKGRGNVEMGSLEIRFMEEKALLELGKKNFSEIFNLISEFEKKVKAEEKDQEKGYKEFNYFIKSYFVVDLEKEADGILEKIENLKMPLNVKAKYNEAKYTSDLKKISPIIIVMNKELIKLVSENSYPLNEYEIGVTIAKTDSNGRFTAKIPLSKKGWLIAHAQRQTFNSIEEYYWLEPIFSDSIMLTNDNLWK